MSIFNGAKKPEKNFANVPFATAVDAANGNISPTSIEGIDLEASDPFWFRPTIEPLNWNKNFPYQLMVVKIGNDGAPIWDNNWRYTLPVPPESLSINMPFASTIHATQGGVVEEHNGAPFRNISISGTTGILPIRGNAGEAKSLNPAQSIFAGTIRNASRFQTIASNLGFAKVKNTVTKSDLQGQVGQGSGYFQFHTLSQFLERYAVFKKTAAGRDYRLALMMWKDQHFYLVKPESFNLSRNAGSPYEYKYSMSFKAWKRVKFQGNAPNEFKYTPAVRDSGIIGQVLQVLQSARMAIAVAIDTIKAMGDDIDNAVMEPLRQSILLCKDLLGIPKALSDMPKQIINGAAGAVVLAMSTGRAYEAFNAPGPDGVGAYQKEWEDMVKLAKETRELGKLALSGEFNASTNITPYGWVISQSANKVPQNFINSYLASPAMRMFEDPNSYVGFFDKIPLGALQISKNLRQQMENDAEKIRRESNRLYWENKRNQLQKTLDNFEKYVGAADPFVAEVYGEEYVEPDHEPTSEDFDIIFNLNNAIQAMSQLAVSEDINFSAPSPTAFIAGLATQSGIAFREPRGKFLVPVPYGFSLEQIAARYLGDPNRWLEIAALNGLVSPYIDETGFQIPLSLNGNENQIVLANADNLYVGQPVSLISNGKNKTSRSITKIKKVSNTYFIIYLDGEDDLGDYLVSDNAVLHAFLPNTINSQMSLYIPSDEDPQFADFIYKPIPNVDDFDPLFRVAGIDLLLDANNDIVITTDGHTPLAVGLSAIIQDLRIKVSTPRGSILQHPSFGLPIDVGVSLADVNAEDLLNALLDTFKGDLTYTNISSAQVRVQGPTSQINFMVGLRGVSEIIPISIDLR